MARSYYQYMGPYATKAEAMRDRQPGDRVYKTKQGWIVRFFPAKHNSIPRKVINSPKLIKGKWTPAHAVRFRRDGGVDIMY
jgi:hypothetical protein